MTLTFRELDDRLRKRYGIPPAIHEDPLESLIGTILSQNTSDINSGRAYESLRAAFPEWKDLAAATDDAIADAIRCGGLADAKARWIGHILRDIGENGEYSLDQLRGLPPQQAEEALMRYPGVGYKTARCVLLFAFNYDVFPIDTHIERILKRLGLAPETMDANAMHRALAPRVPKGRALSLHLNLIKHGRLTCHARNPECNGCCLKPRCPQRHCPAAE
jgi:endonuclease III